VIANLNFRNNIKIEEYLRKEKTAFEKHRQEPKVLILGSSDSGKSTLLKQMKILHGKGFTDEERHSEKRKIRSSILWSVIAILELCTEFENRELVQVSLLYENSSNNHESNTIHSRTYTKDTSTEKSAHKKKSIHLKRPG
jgi:ABC-type lipoprotein export system ATPase subunit